MPGIFISEQVSLVFRQRSLSWWSSPSGRSATGLLGNPPFYYGHRELGSGLELFASYCTCHLIDAGMWVLE